MQELITKKEILEKSNNQIKLLKEELKTLQESIEKKETEKDKLISERTLKSQLVESLKTQQTNCNDYLADFKGVDFAEEFALFEDKFKKELKDFW